MVSQQEPIRSEADYEKARALGRVWGVSGQAVLFAPPFRNKENNHKEGQKQQRVDAVLMHGGGRARQHGAPSKQTYSAQSQCWEMLPAYLDCPGAVEKRPNAVSADRWKRQTDWNRRTEVLQTCVMKIAALQWAGRRAHLLWPRRPAPLESTFSMPAG